MGYLDRFKTSSKFAKVVQLRPRTGSQEKDKDFVKLPLYWAEALRDANGLNTVLLANTILFEAYKQRWFQSKWPRGEIVLSKEVTRMDRSSRRRAIRDLVQIGLIETEQKGQGAIRVTKLHLRESYYLSRDRE